MLIEVTKKCINRGDEKSHPIAIALANATKLNDYLFEVYYNGHYVVITFKNYQRAVNKVFFIDNQEVINFCKEYRNYLYNRKTKPRPFKFNMGEDDFGFYDIVGSITKSIRESLNDYD
jgi:hypothetical protein